MRLIEGTFLQFWASMREVSAAQWAKELDAMRAVKIHTIILQWTQADGRNLFETPDPFPAILRLAHQRGMKFVFGLRYDGRWWREWGNPQYLRGEATESIALAREVHRRYGKHPAFAGFYIPYELWDGLLTEAQTEHLREMLHTISSACRQLTPGKPVLLAPFFSGQLSPERFEQLWLRLLRDRPVDVVALQDGVGARGWDGQIEEKVPPYFAAMQHACKEHGVALWCDLECFRLTNNNPSRPEFAPATAERIVRQLKVVSAYVQRVVTFDFYHYMSPYRGEAQRTLYERYRSIVASAANH
ncbi:MAG: DUF4434 domain-containing protein [Armatimonadota bacterium]|nr:DUF4434 domain-containing protein [bacterium]MDW8320524.1 DUF4434 domain-containing protein [Armatimonadota bacterium]